MRAFQRSQIISSSTSASDAGLETVPAVHRRHELVFTVALLIAVCAGFGYSKPVSGQSCNPQFRQANQDGFGDSRNVYAWSMKTFGEGLYVGTGAREGRSRGAEIWRFDGEEWNQVVSRGLESKHNRGVRNLVVFENQLYAGTANHVKGAEVWRSADGETWSVVATSGFGDTGNESVRAMAAHLGHIYVGLMRSDPAAGQIWRSADGDNWTPVVLDGFGSTENDGILAMAVFNGLLYVGTSNKSQGLEIWRTADGLQFEPVVGPVPAGTPSGFGDARNIAVLDLEVYQGAMYVGTANFRGFGMFRTFDGTNYETITTNGLGDPGNAYSWRFRAFDDHLWLGVFNVLNFLSGIKGGSLWRSADGLQWEEMVGGGPGALLPYGFGDPFNWGMRTLETFDGSLYIGTANCFLSRCTGVAGGAEVWEWPGEDCTEQ